MGAAQEVEWIMPVAQYDSVRSALEDLGFPVTLTEVRTSGGRHMKRKLVYRGCEYDAQPEMVQLELLVPANAVRDVLRTSAKSSSTLWLR